MSLPSGYKQLEYIQSHAAEFINSGVYATQNTRVEAKAEFLSSDNYPMLCGAYTSGSSQFAVFYHNGMWRAWFGTDAKTITDDFSGLNTFQLGGGTFQVSENSVAVSSSSFKTTLTILIFAMSQGNTQYYHSSIRLYYLKIYESNALVRDYVPAKRISDNVIGLYDLVESKFYTNSGSGAFTAGPEVSTLVHKVLVNSTVYPTDRGKVMVNETIYWLTKGKTLKDETIYEIPFVRPEGDPDVPIEPDKTITVTMTGTMGTGSNWRNLVTVDGVTYSSAITISAPYGAEITVIYEDGSDIRVYFNGTLYNKNMTFLAYSDVTIAFVLSAFVTVDDYEIV